MTEWESVCIGVHQRSSAVEKAVVSSQLTVLRESPSRGRLGYTSSLFFLFLSAMVVLVAVKGRTAILCG